MPQSTVAGERTSPTQPFPTKTAPYERQGATEDNLIDFTPELREEAKKILEQYEHGPIFTPPTERGTINLPGWAGGANWWGAAFDPQTQTLYIPSITAPIVVKLVKPDAARSNFNYVRGGASVGALIDLGGAAAHQVLKRRLHAGQVFFARLLDLRVRGLGGAGSAVRTALRERLGRRLREV